MKKRLLKTFSLAIILVFIQFAFAFSPAALVADAAKTADKTVYLGGFPAGFEIQSRGAFVVKTTDVVTDSGVLSPSKEAGVHEGDILLTVGGVEISCAEDVGKGLSGYSGGEIVLTLMRDGNEIIKSITPVKDINGKLRLGVMLRDGTSGIGTMTFIDDDKNFMALGHPILGDGGEMVKIKRGVIYRCSIFGVNKGERGRAGELKGMFISDAPIGSVNGNVEQGIFGKMNEDFDVGVLPRIAIGKAEMGKASIVTCIDGVIPKEYAISIVKSDEFKDDKNLVIKVTDKSLLSEAGGIVQGMSGSPIVQNGKLVGAITHVFVNDPTRGYGIDIGNMLEVIG